MNSRNPFLLLFATLFNLGTFSPPAFALDCDQYLRQVIPAPDLRQRYADQAEHYYQIITELEKKEREPGTGSSTLVLLLAKLEKNRDELMELNLKNHKLLAHLREPDGVFSQIAALDRAANPLREKLIQLNESLGNHEVLVNNLRGADQQKALRVLKQLREERTSLQSDLSPLEAKIRTAFAKAPPEERLKQVTGKSNIPGENPAHIETADPFIYQLRDGRVRILGSGWVNREYASFDHLMRNIGEKITTTDLRYPGGEVIESRVYGMGGPVWDKSIVETPQGEVLYASALSPKKYRAGGLPTDAAYTTTATENWTRRIYAFSKKYEITSPLDGTKKIWNSYAEFLNAHPEFTYEQLKSLRPHELWVRDLHDLWGNQVPMEENWEGHSYGVKVRLGPDWKPLLDEEGHPYVEFERVSSPDGKLGNTAPFAQRLSSNGRAEGPMHQLMEYDYPERDPLTGKEAKKSYPITIRSFNQRLRLIEGPQTAPQLLELSDFKNLKTLTKKHYSNFKKRWAKFGIADNKLKFKVTAVAGGDYPTKDYGLLVGVRPVSNAAPMVEQMKGLFPVVEKTPRGDLDLKHLGRALGYRNRISWGPSRPLFFKRDDRWWVLFHGIDETVVGKNFNPRVWPPDSRIDEVARNVYLSPADPVILPDGQISFELVDPHP